MDIKSFNKEMLKIIYILFIFLSKIKIKEAKIVHKIFRKKSTLIALFSLFGVVKIICK